MKGIPQKGLPHLGDLLDRLCMPPTPFNPYEFQTFSECLCIAIGISTQVITFIIILSALSRLFQHCVTCRNFTLTGPLIRSFLQEVSQYQ